jgi:hypothetical protein
MQYSILGKGRKKFKFIISPKDFESIFCDFHFVENCQRVPVDYIKTSSEEMLEKYTIFYNKLVSGYKFVYEDDWKLLNFFPLGLTHDLSKMEYYDKFMDKADKQWYKVHNEVEPCVHIGFFTLLYEKDKAIHKNFSFLACTENVMGIEIIFPKEIVYESDIDKIYNYDEIETYYKVYEKIVERIKGISKNMVLIIDGKEYRTDIKLSHNSKEEIANTYFMKNNKCVNR